MKIDLVTSSTVYVKEILTRIYLPDYGGTPDFDLTSPDKVEMLRQCAIDQFNREFNQQVRVRQSAMFREYAQQRSEHRRWEEDTLQLLLYEILRLGLHQTALDIYMQYRNWSRKEASARLMEMQIEINRER